MVLLQMSLEEAIGYVAFDELIEMINYCQFVTCHRFDSKRFCRDCRTNVIRIFKELKELKRMRREPHYSSWFCVADAVFYFMNQVDGDIKSSSCGGGYSYDEGSRSNMARIANFS
ncbi:hypothetical protein BC332_01700 [Capsicum chinense]|nr:hypothetical protein BC332_01700 [Capsicum chinense]